MLAGAYIYIETSSPRHKGQRAVLSSGIQAATPAGGQCLSFWYHMFGAHVNTLNVYIKSQGGNRTMIWSRSRTQGNVWRNGLRTVQSRVPFEILFEGIVGYSWQGDIAMDDISLDDGICPPPSTLPEHYKIPFFFIMNVLKNLLLCFQILSCEEAILSSWLVEDWWFYPGACLCRKYCTEGYLGSCSTQPLKGDISIRSRSLVNMLLFRIM